MRLTAFAEDRAPDGTPDAHAALAAYEARDAERVAIWNARFAG